MTDFVDANVLVYLVSEDARRTRAIEIMEGSPATSVQSINELVNVMRRKLHATFEEQREASEAVRDLCAFIHPVLVDDHVTALGLMPRYNLQWWDALLIATALRAGATRFLSEDGHDGLIIDGRLTIANPFRA